MGFLPQKIRNVELLRSRYMENLPILRELFYANLLDGRIEPGTERERAARLQAAP